MSVKQAQLDPVTLEVIRNALPAIANEMAADLQRTSYNMMIYEVRDYCTALVNPQGELINVVIKRDSSLDAAATAALRGKRRSEPQPKIL